MTKVFEPMKARKLGALGSLGSLAMFVALSPQIPCAGGDGPRESERVVSTTLTAIRQNPDAYRNVWVSFPAQFAAIGKVSNPFFTQFVPSHFANLQVWADEQPIWQEKDYRDIFGLLFMSKENEQLPEVYQLGVYQRVQITGIVRNTFQSRPWIEVTSFTLMDGKVNTATLAHIYRGEKFMAKRQWTKAISELQKAPAADLPQVVQAEIHKELATCYLRLGESGTAVQHVETALSLTPNPDQELLQLAEIAKVNPKAGLDRSVHDVQMSDHERPMWEAFGLDQGTRTQNQPAQPPQGR